MKTADRLLLLWLNERAASLRGAARKARASYRHGGEMLRAAERLAAIHEQAAGLYEEEAGRVERGET